MSTKAGDKIKVYKYLEIIIMVSQGSYARHEVCGNYIEMDVQSTQNSRVTSVERGWPFSLLFKGK